MTTLSDTPKAQKRWSWEEVDVSFGATMRTLYYDKDNLGSVGGYVRQVVAHREQIERHPLYDLIPQMCDALNQHEALKAERNALREVLIGMVLQFAYPIAPTKNFNTGGISTGGLSALEDAFAVLGLSDPCMEAALASSDEEKV